MKNNLLLLGDSYKSSHYLQYPPGTEIVSSYIESRGGGFSRSLFFGLQAFIQEYLMEPITYADICEAREMMEAHGEPFNTDGWMEILNRHGGRLTIEITAVPEGSVVPIGNVLVQVQNTDIRFPWLTSFIETALLRGVWYPSTVATLSFESKRIILKYLRMTSDDPMGQLPFKLHDFGARGVSSQESAMLGGLAHLVNFKGTDTVAALVAARRYYGCHMAGFSIPAAEHSTITSWGKDGEADAYRNMLTQFARPGKLVAVVSDSYDIWLAVSEIWGKELKDKVLTSGATVVIRPDSGYPPITVLSVIKSLMTTFGYTKNQKGYAVLNPAVRVIQGDGMDLPMIGTVLELLTANGISADNVAFGMGGALLQKVDRDTMSWAMKASAVKVNGFWRDVYKKPVGDDSKASKKGRLDLIKVAGNYKTVLWGHTEGAESLLEPVYRDGRMLRMTILDEVRTRAEAELQP